MVVVFLLALGFGYFGLGDENHARASCVQTAPAGLWANVRREANTLSTVEVVRECLSDGARAGFRVRAFETCTPRDCSWGWVKGVLTAEGRMVARFRTFSAERMLVLEPFGQQMRVRVEIDFISPNRADVDASHILVRRAN